MTRKRLITIGVLTMVVILFVLFSPYGLVTRFSLESTATSLRAQVQYQQHIVDSLRGNVKHLQEDTTEIERLARERYGYIRPGDEVFIIRRNHNN